MKRKPSYAAAKRAVDAFQRCWCTPRPGVVETTEAKRQRALDARWLLPIAWDLVQALPAGPKRDDLEFILVADLVQRVAPRIDANQEPAVH